MNSKQGVVGKNFLAGSRVVVTIGRWARSWKKRAYRSYRRIRIFIRLHAAWDVWCAAPIATFSLVLITAIVTHTLLSLLLSRAIPLGEWLGKSLAGIMALVGFAHSGDWAAVKQGSLLMRMRRRFTTHS